MPLTTDSPSPVSHVLRLAKAQDTVVVTCSERKGALVRSVGASSDVDYIPCTDGLAGGGLPRERAAPGRTYAAQPFDIFDMI